MGRVRVRDGRCACVGLHGRETECAMAEGVRLLAAPYALDVMLAVSRAPAPLRFGELRRALDLAPNTLARRLAALVEAGALEKRGEGYRTTAQGARLVRGALALEGWRA